MLQRLLEPVGVDVAAAVGADRARVDQLLEGADRLRDRGRRIHLVREVEVDRVDPEPLQARRELAPDPCRREAGVGALAHRVEGLRRQDDPLAHRGPPAAQPVAEVGLAATAAVRVRRVVRRDPGLPGGVEERVRLALGLTRAEERGRRADAAEVAAAEDDARHVDAAGAEGALLHGAMLRAVSQVVREVEQGERVACERRRAPAVAPRSQRARVLPEDARPRGGVVEPAVRPLLAAARRVAGEATLRPRPRSSSGGSCSIRSIPVARNCSSAFSFAASLRSSCSDGTRSPASSREMYAAEHPGKESCRWESPAARRASLSRRPTAAGSSTCEW